MNDVAASVVTDNRHTHTNPSTVTLQRMRRGLIGSPQLTLGVCAAGLRYICMYACKATVLNLYWALCLHSATDCY